jgi:toxin YoeB
LNLVFSTGAWEDFLYWHGTDRKTLNRLNALIKECTRTPYEGTGKPEPLRANLAGWWSRRLTIEHRLVYRRTEQSLQILQCRFHY